MTLGKDYAPLPIFIVFQRQCFDVCRCDKLDCRRDRVTASRRIAPVFYSSRKSNVSLTA